SLITFVRVAALRMCAASTINRRFISASARTGAGPARNTAYVLAAMQERANEVTGGPHDRASRARGQGKRIKKSPVASRQSASRQLGGTGDRRLRLTISDSRLPTGDLRLATCDLRLLTAFLRNRTWRRTEPAAAFGTAVACRPAPA